MSRPELTPGNGGGGKPRKPESENVWQFPWLIPQPESEESTLVQSPHLEYVGPPPPPVSTAPEPKPVVGPPAFDTGPSPYFTQEVTRYAQPPSSEVEAKRRTQRIERLRERWEKARQRATTVSPPPTIEETAPDIGEDDLADFEQLPVPDSPDWPVSTPLSQGQELHVDHLLSVETDPLAREVLFTIKREGLPPRSQWQDFMSQYALWSWDATSDAQAWATLATIAQSDWNAWLERADLQQESKRQAETRLGMGGGRGDTDVDDSDSTNLVSSYQELEAYVTSEFEIQIEWGKEFDDLRSRRTQLHKLHRAITYIVNYLAKEVYGDKDRALDAFKEHFGQSEKHGQLVVQLGADKYFVENFSILETDAGYYGFVPLPPPEAESIEGGDDNWDMMFLGSNVDIATIVHEFGHVIDRSLNIVDEYNAAAKKGILLPAWKKFYDDTGLLLTDSILQYGIEGFAGKQNANEEFWADLFMTAVLDSVVGGPLTVYSSTYERIENLSPTQFDRCLGEGACSRQPVEWTDQSPNAYLDFGALAQEHFPTLLRKLLNG